MAGNFGQRDDTGERNLPPTPHRLAEAKRHGNVARSADLTAAAAIVGGVVVLAMLAGGVLAEARGVMAAVLGGGAGIDCRGGAGLGDAAAGACWSLTVAVGGLLAALFGVALLAAAVQVGSAAATERLGPDWARLSPSGGLRRMFSARSAVAAALTMAKVLAVAAIGYEAIGSLLGRLSATAGMEAASLAKEIGRSAGGPALRAGLALLAVGAVDWLYQRWQHRRDLRMTRREWMDEMKQTGSDGRAKRTAIRT